MALANLRKTNVSILIFSALFQYIIAYFDTERFRLYKTCYIYEITGNRGYISY